MKLEHCYPAKVLPESSKNRDQCLVALRHFIIMQQPRVCRLDFPFGLPRELVREDSWEEFILSFGNRYRILRSLGKPAAETLTVANAGV